MHKLYPVVVSGDYSLAAVSGLHITVPSLVAEHRLQGAQASVVTAGGLSGSQVELSPGLWDLP